MILDIPDGAPGGTRVVRARHIETSTGPGTRVWLDRAVVARVQLRFVDEAQLNLPGPGAWVSAKRFEVLDQQTDQFSLQALVAHPDYLDLYMGGHEVGQAESGQGPYRLDAVQASNFVSSTEPAVQVELSSWVASLYDDASLRLDARQLVREFVGSLVAEGRIYSLGGLDQGSWHDAGWVVGHFGFHEWVVLADDGASLNLLVASDD